MKNLNMLTQLANPNSNNSSNIRVFVRFSPLNDIEKDLLNNGVGQVCVDYINNLPNSNNPTFISKLKQFLLPKIYPFPTYMMLFLIRIPSKKIYMNLSGRILKMMYSLGIMELFLPMDKVVWKNLFYVRE